jgi:uncharacterized YkwD family protein
MRPKARLLLLLVVVPVVVVGLVVTVGRTVLSDDDSESAASTVTLSEPPPPALPDETESSDPEPSESDEAKKEKSKASPTKSARVESKKSDKGEASEEKKTSEPTKSSGSTSASTTIANQVVKLTNAERTKAGCKPLRSNAQLKTAAQKHSADMAKQDYFSHTSKNGKSPFDRMSDAGYSFSAAAENIAAGQRTAADVVEGWMNSEGHKANILNCTYTEIGVGYAKGGSYGTYWTQNFGRPA